LERARLSLSLNKTPRPPAAAAAARLKNPSKQQPNNTPPPPTHTQKKTRESSTGLVFSLLLFKPDNYLESKFKKKKKNKARF
jgi:hypothetical protein